MDDAVFRLRLSRRPNEYSIQIVLFTYGHFESHKRH